MRTLSDSLFAAQRKADRLPYVEAKVYDYEAGIKRLTWTRLYEGSEPDNHHGIAFDGQGSMHRIRAAEEEGGGSYGSDFCNGGTASADSVYSGYPSALAFDNDEETFWASQNTAFPHWIKYDLGSGVTKTARKLRFKPRVIPGGSTVKDFKLQGSNNDSEWTDILTSAAANSETWQEWIFNNPTAYRYYRLYVTSDYNTNYDYCEFFEIELMEWIPTCTYTLYRQKITSPGPSSDYSQWTQIATDCAGPCAIAAYGAKVYIFYKTTGNVLWKYYSHDYGQTWDDAQLVDYADVLSLAACWWGTGNIVVCFALKSNQLNGITLDTSTQTATPHTWSDGNHPLLDTYGIGATYNPFWPAIEIVFAGKESDSPYNHYDLFRTKFSNTYNFLALESFLMSPDGEDITYEYPDCHLPSGAQSYETNRIVAVEKFTGDIAYTRPLACHMVKGTCWSDTTFTEPKPFLDISSGYGLRLQSTSDYWWMERPDGVWRAPRPADSPLDLTKDIVSLQQNVIASPDKSGRGNLVIELDNSKGQYVPIPSGLRFRSEIVLELGYKTTAGSETSEAGTYWIDSWEYSSKPNMSRFILTCLDGWGLMDRWTARYQMRWNKDEVNPKSVWQILYQLLARVGIKLTNTPPKPQSSAINNFYPDFTVNPGTRGDSAIRRLLSFVPDKLVFRGQEAFTKNPLASESSCYSYGTDHAILSGKYTEAVTVSRARAIGRDSGDNRILEEALDWDLLALGIDILEQDYDPNLQDAARAQERADAILRTRAQEAEPAVITIGTNVGQKLLDVVEVTDERCGISGEKYRVQAIQTDYDRRQGIYTQRLELCAP